MKFPGMVLKNKSEPVLHYSTSSCFKMEVSFKYQMLTFLLFSVLMLPTFTGLGILVNDEEAAKANCKAVVFDKCVDGLKLCLFVTKYIVAE